MEVNNHKIQQPWLVSIIFPYGMPMPIHSKFQYFFLLVNPHVLNKAGDDLEEVEVGLPAMSVLATAQQLGRMEL